MHMNLPDHYKNQQTEHSLQQLSTNLKETVHLDKHRYSSRQQHPRIIQEEDLSLTEKAINERRIEWIDTARKNCLVHTHKVIASDTKIYRDFHSDVGRKKPSPRQKQHFRRIYKTITNEPKPWETVQSFGKARKIRSSTRTKTEPNERYGTKGISMSALTTYNFTSIKARHRLAFDPHGAEEEVRQKIESAQEKAQAAEARSLLIHMKTDPVEAALKKDMDDAITHNYTGIGTTAYLRGLQKWRNDNSNVYGSKAKHLKSVAQCMQAGETQNQAEFIVNEIRLSIPKKGKNRQKQQRNRLEKQRLSAWEREQQDFEGRKEPRGRRRVCVSAV